MRDRKELIYLNMKDLTQEEIDSLGDMELNCCDECEEIDISTKLNWIEGEDFWDNEAAMALVRKGTCAVCNECLDKAVKKMDIFPEEKQNEYKVTYEIDVWAKNPEEAAKQVHQYMRDRGSYPPFFKVIDKDGNEVEIDLMKDNE